MTDATDTPPQGRMLPPNGGSRPVPDPTELTDRAIGKLEAQLREWVESQLAIRDERLRGIDEATKLRLDQVGAVADRFGEKVDRLREVHDERFASVDKQFAERDTRQERESRDNKVAVDAAFAAQKEAAAKQDEGNAKAIDKSEVGTKERLDSLAALMTTGLSSLGARIDEIKGRLDRGEGRTTGGIDSRTLTFAILGVVILMLSVGVSIFTAVTP